MKSFKRSKGRLGDLEGGVKAMGSERKIGSEQGRPNPYLTHMNLGIQEIGHIAGEGASFEAKPGSSERGESCSTRTQTLE
jgi:hypothetical protein